MWPCWIPTMDILNAGSFILSPPLIIPMRKAGQSWWVAGEAARSSPPPSPASSHKPNYTCSPAYTSQRDPHCCLGCTRSVHEADILAGGGVIPTPTLTSFRYAHAHSAHASILGFPTTLAVLTPSCSFPQVPQSELRMDSGPCRMLTVSTIEVSPFTLLAPLVANVPRPSEPNLRIHLRCVVLPQQIS